MIDRKPEKADRVDAAGLQTFVSRIVSDHAGKEIIYLCIGTDRSTGTVSVHWSARC